MKRCVYILPLLLMVFASCQTSGNKEEKMKDLISTYLTFNESVSYDGEY